MPSTIFEQQPLSSNGVGNDLIVELKNQFKSELKFELYQELRTALDSTNGNTNGSINGTASGTTNGTTNDTTNGTTNGRPSSNGNASPRVPESIFTPIYHPIMEDAIRDVDGYFLQQWHFPDMKSRKKFVAAGFSRVTCLYFPKALNERIRMACSLLTILFLIDGKKRSFPNPHVKLLLMLCTRST